MVNYKHPGVYIQEDSGAFPNVVGVNSALPAFIGYTEKALDEQGNTLGNIPTLITSLLEYERFFGSSPYLRLLSLDLDADGNISSVNAETEWYLYDSLRLFYDNGGAACYIVSVGNYDKGRPEPAALENGLKALEATPDPTLLLAPDACKLSTPDASYGFYAAMLAHCAGQANRFAILSMREDGDTVQADAETFRSAIGMNNLQNGAVYTPYLCSALPKRLRIADIDTVLKVSGTKKSLKELTEKDTVKAALSDLTKAQTADTPDSGEIHKLEKSLRTALPVYHRIQQAFDDLALSYPPEGALAGIYTHMDNTQGVWNAPANVSVQNVRELTRSITNREQESLNVDVVSGKSIDAIRFFTGQGILVWGARTLAGNDEDWRYISVRRLVSYIEASVKQSLQWVVFEPNNAATWASVRTMVENFLSDLWKNGAFFGTTQQQAFSVNVGLGHTMTEQDIQAGRMLLVIKLAVQRPAEFIIVTIEQTMQAA